MKALVVGGGGFVGPYLVRHLKDELGYEVTGQTDRGLPYSILPKRPL